MNVQQFMKVFSQQTGNFIIDVQSHNSQDMTKYLKQDRFFPNFIRVKWKEPKIENHLQKPHLRN